MKEKLENSDGNMTFEPFLGRRASRFLVSRLLSKPTTDSARTPGPALFSLYRGRQSFPRGSVYGLAIGRLGWGRFVMNLPVHYWELTLPLFNSCNSQLWHAQSSMSHTQVRSLVTVSDSRVKQAWKQVPNDFGYKAAHNSVVTGTANTHQKEKECSFSVETRMSPVFFSKHIRLPS